MKKPIRPFYLNHRGSLENVIPWFSFYRSRLIYSLLQLLRCVRIDVTRWKEGQSTMDANCLIVLCLSVSLLSCPVMGQLADTSKGTLLLVDRDRDVLATRWIRSLSRPRFVHECVLQVSQMARGRWNWIRMATEDENFCNLVPSTYPICNLWSTIVKTRIRD